MSETWYEVPGWSDDVRPITVVKVTAKTVTVLNHGRESRRSREGIFPTEEEAVGYIIARRRRKVSAAKAALDRERSREAAIRAAYPKHPAWNEPIGATTGE